MFRARDHKFENFPTDGTDIHTPGEHIDEHILDALSAQGWKGLLSSLNDSSAPGLSNISYKMTKNTTIAS